MKAKLKTALVLLLLLSALSCTLKPSRAGIPPQVQAAVDGVSNDIAEGRYEKIYAEAAEEWRRAATPEQSEATFKRLKEVLGPVKGRSFHEAAEKDVAGTHTFVLGYRTTFDRGDGMETFTLVERQGRWQLARYFVNSNELK